MGSVNTAAWNPRYLAYSRAHGQEDPEAMLAFDRERFPGGCMTGFLIWNNARWAEWYRLNPERNPRITSRADHVAYDAWLEARVQQADLPVIE